MIILPNREAPGKSLIIDRLLTAMHRRKKVLTLVVLVALALIWWCCEREPRYQGRPLGAWLDTYQQILLGQLTEPGFEETRSALRSFGSTALASYTRHLAFEPSWESSVLAWMERAPSPLRRIAAQLAVSWRNDIDVRQRRADTAVRAFELLGTDAATAGPGLIRLALRTPYTRRTQRALSALSYLGPAGASALGEVVLKGDPAASAEAFRLLRRMGTNAPPVWALLSQTLGSNLPASPRDYEKVSVALLVDSARYSNRVARLRAMSTLSSWRPSALYPLTNDNSADVRVDASNAIHHAGPPERTSYSDAEKKMFRKRYGTTVPGPGS